MKREFIISVVISLTFLSAGFLLLHFELIGYGLSFFVFLPFLLGFILGKSTLKTASLYGLVISIVMFFILLITGGLEGMVCILMAMPLVLIAVALGLLAKKLLKLKREKSENMLKSSIVPFLLFFAFGTTEHRLNENNNTVVEIHSTLELDHSSMEVYDAIKSVDTLIAEKPFLMKLDLPIPHKCVLEGEKIGGLRTCYFEGGQILERITELKKGRILKMDVIDYQLTGREWLSFKEAIYTFDELGSEKTKMTRITTYSSELYPRFYWQPLEKIGIEQEHIYVFRNLVRDLKNNSGGSTDI